MANTCQLKNNVLNKHSTLLKLGLIKDASEKYSNPKSENENDPGFKFPNKNAFSNDMAVQMNGRSY